MSVKRPRSLNLRLPPLTPATAAALWDLCGFLQQAIWREYGEELEKHWQEVEPDKVIYGSVADLDDRKR